MRSLMEYITVTFAEKRDVIIDGEVAGATDETLEVERGTHRIRLDGDQNYTPKWRQPAVKGTTVVNPMQITFDEA
jgi:hypothetical protein